jgi:CHASE2 domain-containing sensor protein
LKRKRKESFVAELDTEDREKMDKRKFAYVDKEGEGHLPINDDEHVRNAMARFNQTDFESGTKKETARKKIVTAAKRRGIKVAKTDNVVKSRKTSARKTSTRTKKTGSSRKKKAKR